MLKIILKVLLGLVITGLLAVIATITLVDLNHFKDTLSHQIKKQTGRHIDIQGDMKWTLTPWLSLELQKVHLSNAAAFNNDFLTVNKLWVEPHFSSLLTGRLFVNIELEGVDLHLETQASGHNNWEDLVQRFARTDTAPEQNSDAKFPIQILVGGLKLTDGRIEWQDLAKKQHLQLKHTHLSAEKLYKALLGNPTPLTLSAHLDDLQTKKFANIAFNTQLQVHPKQKKLDLEEIVLKLQLQDGIPATLTGELHVENFDAQPTIQGKLKLPTLKTQEWVKGWLTEVPEDFPKTFGAKMAFTYQAPMLDISALELTIDNGKIDAQLKLHYDATLHGLARILNGEGQVNASNLSFGKTDIPSFDSKIQLKQALVQLAPYRLNVFNSIHTGTLSIDLRSEVPQFTLDQMAQEFDMNALLKAFGHDNKLVAKGSLKSHFTSHGTSPAEWQKNLTGRSEMALHNGVLQGINLEYLLKHAQTTIKSMVSAIKARSFSDFGNHVREEFGQWKEQSSGSTGFSTPFDTLKTSITVQQQNVHNPDFEMFDKQYQVKGAGNIDLNLSTIQYQLHANLIQPETNDSLSAFFQTTPLSIKVSGALANPAVKPDLEHYMQSAMKHTQRNAIEDFAGKTLQKLFQR